MNRKAQSILEYVIILAVIVVAVLVGSTLIKNAVNKTMNSAANVVNSAADTLQDEMFP